MTSWCLPVLLLRVLGVSVVCVGADGGGGGARWRGGAPQPDSLWLCCLGFPSGCHSEVLLTHDVPLQEVLHHRFVVPVPASTRTVFGDLGTAAGLRALNEFLAPRSYIEGFVASSADTEVLGAIPADCPPPPALCHALRWYRHARSLGAGCGLPAARRRYVLKAE
ncbi:unnamed protein product [Arctogadus glacialis]